MADHQEPARTTLSREELLAELAKFEPPPIQVVYQGWLRTTVTERSVADLEREDALRTQRERRA